MYCESLVYKVTEGENLTHNYVPTNAQQGLANRKKRSENNKKQNNNEKNRCLFCRPVGALKLSKLEYAMIQIE